jgi:hypothetical protein
VESRQCISLSVCFIGLAHPINFRDFLDLNCSLQNLLYPVLQWQIIVIEGAFRTLDWAALIDLTLFVICAYAPLAIRLVLEIGLKGRGFGYKLMLIL